jgi:hypothetical protein
MPTNPLRRSTFTTAEAAISIFANGQFMRNQRQATLNPLNLQTTFTDPAYGTGKVILPGTAVSLTASSGYRAFPANRALAATTVAQNSLTVKNAYVYKVGDVLTNGFGGATIGTVTAINVATGVITLAANAAVAVAIRDIIVATDGGAVASILGFNIAATDVLRESNDLGLFTAANVKGELMPFWSTELATAFPSIEFMKPLAAINFP